MVMGHFVAERWEETLRRIRFGTIRRGVNQALAIPVEIDGFAELLGAPDGVDAEIIGQNHGNLAPHLGTLDEVIDLATIGVGGASQGKAVGEPAIVPIGGDEGDDFGTLARGADQTLAVVTLARPASGERGMQPDVDFVLDGEVGFGQQAQQIGDIGGKLIPEIVGDEGVPIEGRGSRRCWRHA